MRNYEAPKAKGKPDWSQVPVAPIDNRLWSNVDGITPTAQLCWDEKALHVRLQTLEEHILCRFTGPLADVYKDSCLEIFFCPKPEGERYFNFECNPNGAMYIGYGRPGTLRCRLTMDEFEGLVAEPFRFPGGWGIELTIPASLIEIFVPDFKLYEGQVLRGNFFKCGDETVQPHYMAWNKVDVPAPQFHLPEFFGNIVLK